MRTRLQLKLPIAYAITGSFNGTAYEQLTADSVSSGICDPLKLLLSSAAILVDGRNRASTSTSRDQMT
jgi:hypothetical protein